MNQQRFGLIALITIFLLERIFVFPLLPVAVVLLGLSLGTRKFWLMIGALGLLSDLFVGVPFGTWGLSYLLPVIMVVVVLRGSQLTPRIPILALLGFGITLTGGIVGSWLLSWAITLPPRSVLVAELGWSFLATIGFGLIRSRFLTEELRIKY